MEDDEVLSLNRHESYLTNPPGHLRRDKWTALSGPLPSSLYGASGGTAEQEKNNLNRFTDFRTKNGSSQGQNLALTVLVIPSSLDSGYFEYTNPQHSRSLQQSNF